MKIHFYLFVLILLFLQSCVKEENIVVPSNPKEAQLTGTISLPSNINQNNFKIFSGLKEGTISNSNYSIGINENAVQLITVVDGSEQPILLNISLGEKESEKVINSETTAEALILLNPFICTSNKIEASEFKEKIHALSSFQSLINLIDAQLSSGEFTINDNNTDLQHALEGVYSELVSGLELNYLKMRKSSLLKSQTEPNPGFEVNGLQVINFSEEESQIKFKIRNSFKRWISIYTDKSNGSNIEYSSLPSDIIPSPEISIWNILVHGVLIVPEESKEIIINNANFQTIDANCYGLGVFNNLNDREFDRAIFPSSMSVVFDLTLPVIEVLSGLNLHAELRGHPTNHPFYSLVGKILEEIHYNIDIQVRLLRCLREGNITRILLELTQISIKKIIREPSLIADILTQILGEAVARSIVNNWLFPLRLINASVTLGNLSYTLASILSTECLTTFQFSKNSNLLPIKVEGIVKDVSNGSNLSNCMINSYDENNILVSSCISDNLGKYNFYSNPGRIRVRASILGFISVDQYFDIPEDLINQNPAVYNASPIWMTSFSNENGNIDGFVKNATNLNVLSNVNIKLKFGVNDPSQEILQETTSLSTGFYSFLDIPPGTYTAYFSKEGFIDDYLVVSVIGNQTITGFDMNLSPNISTDGFRIILTWGEDPHDLDSHLFTPEIDGSAYHIYFSNRGSLNSPPFANLDVDDVTSYGPETITINALYDGVYYYSIYNYSGNPEIITSNAEINLYGENGFIRKWNIPNSGVGRWWNVFSIDGVSGQITNINSISDSPPFETNVLYRNDFMINK